MTNPKYLQEVPQHARSVLHDCLFLILIVLISTVSYIGRLGFYSDDWGLVAALRGSSEQSLPSLFRLLYSTGFRWRPVQAVYLTLLYETFGVHPLGYHVVNAILLATIACFFYLSLSLLDQPRSLAIGVPLVYVLLPDYSTIRFWICVPGTFCMAFYFINLYTLLRAAQTRGRPALAWMALSVISLFVSTLAYEIAIPLFVVNFMLVKWQDNLKRSTKEGVDFGLGWRFALVCNALALASVLLFKMNTAVRFHPHNFSLSWIKYVVKGSIRVHFIDYGIRLPWLSYLAVRLNPDRQSYALAAILSLSILWYAKSTSQSESTGTAASDMFKFLACGLLVFGAANIMLLVAPGQIGFTTTGAANRTNIATSVGIAMIVVGAIRLLGSLIKNTGVRSVIEGSLVGVVCTMGFLIISTVASFWTRAYQRQQMILADIAQHIPSIPHGTTLVLDGVCPYMGPGIVFECHWDVGGALNLLYHDWTLKGDIVIPRLKVEERGLVIRTHEVTRYYPYSRNLMIYNFSRKITQRLTDAEATRRYFQAMDPTHGGYCAPGTEGYEVRIF